MSEVVFRAIFISTVIILEIIAVILVLSFKVKSSGMNLSQYIRYRLDFKARAEELVKDEKRAEKKRSYFDKLDKVEAHMAKQRESKVMDYEEFDFKQRLKDLGSPLEDEED